MESPDGPALARTGCDGTLPPPKPMQYHLHREGQDLGVHEGEELRRRRLAGELDGTELVWCPGMEEWRPLDEALSTECGPPAFQPPRVEGPVPKASRPRSRLLLTALGGGIGLLGVLILAGLVRIGMASAHRMSGAGRAAVAKVRLDDPGDAGVEAASRPIPLSPQAATLAGLRKRSEAFRRTHYLESYRRVADTRAAWFRDGEELVEAWCQSDDPSKSPTPDARLDLLGDRLASDPRVTDPVLLLVSGLRCREVHERVRRFRRSVAAFHGSRHAALPQLQALCEFSAMHGEAEDTSETDRQAAALVRKVVGPGGIASADQELLARQLVEAWGGKLLEREGAAVVRSARGAGADFDWLADVLEGEHQRKQSWEARGGGFASEVTAEGWKGFETHGRKAAEAFTRAWTRRPERTVAASRMVEVSLSHAGAEEMRLWFDRAVEACVDDPYAWMQMRRGLLARWHGSPSALMALGRAALATGRFDTGVPAVYRDCLADVAEELSGDPDHRLLLRPDVWKDQAALHRGYIAATAGTQGGRRWRSAFAVLSHVSGHPAEAREQMEALDWMPDPEALLGWGADLSLLPAEIAARTGPAGDTVSSAERDRLGGRLEEARTAFRGLAERADLEPAARNYARIQVALLDGEIRLRTGAWIPFLPRSADDPAWHLGRGHIEVSTPESLEIRADPDGHLLHSRLRIGTNFAIRGTWERVRSSTEDIQAGILFGLPDTKTLRFLGARMKRNTDEGEVASVGYGWGRSQIKGPAVVHADRPNRFELEYKDGLVTYRVNDQLIFHDNPTPPLPRIRPEEFHVGIGAFNDVNETVVRYRNVEIRRL